MRKTPNRNLSSTQDLSDDILIEESPINNVDSNGNTKDHSDFTNMSIFNSEIRKKNRMHAKRLANVLYTHLIIG